MNQVGRYALKQKLGAGAMGEVWLAEDSVLKRDVAVKLIPDAMSQDPERRERFEREARLAGRLFHTNTVTVLDFGIENDLIFVVMELVDGESLDKTVARRGRLDWREVTRVIRDAAQGLAAAHELNLVHRDIKPANLMRTTKGVTKVVDFGLARDVYGSTELTRAGTLLGTPDYMAPEQWSGGEANPRSDLYSLICTYYFLLTARPPFQADKPLALGHQHCYEPFPDPTQLVPDLPPEIRHYVERGSQKAPADRYQNAAELITDLEMLLDGTRSNAATFSPPPALPTTPIDPPTVVSVDFKPLQIVTNSIGMKLVLIPAGEFTMGSWDGNDNERPLHKVRISQPFMMATTPTTIGQILQWLNHVEHCDKAWINLSSVYCPIRQNGRTFALQGGGGNFGQSPDQPMVDITWHGATAFADWLSKKENFAYRLPTEAEWEYAARAGSSSKWDFGDNESRLGVFAWFVTNAVGVTRPVCQKKPNLWGLFDMYGNVWEWCQDWFDGSYYAEFAEDEAVDPQGPASRISGRAMRGGSWADNPRTCRSASRRDSEPEHNCNFYGFRLARTWTGETEFESRQHEESPMVIRSIDKAVNKTSVTVTSASGETIETSSVSFNFAWKGGRITVQRPGGGSTHVTVEDLKSITIVPKQPDHGMDIYIEIMTLHGHVVMGHLGNNPWIRFPLAESLSEDEVVRIFALKDMYQPSFKIVGSTMYADVYLRLLQKIILPGTDPNGVTEFHFD